MPRVVREFDWRVYADATAAGLSALIPIPILDLAFERFFRRRMPVAICRARGVAPAPEALAALARSGPWLSAAGCVAAPFALVLAVLKRVSRKILYFLAVREAASQLGLYWHRAWLVDYMARQGVLSEARTADAARAALEATLAAADTSALAHLARQSLRGTRHVFRRLLHARRATADEAFPTQQAFLADQWGAVAAHLGAVTEAFDTRYREAARLDQQPPATTGEGANA